MIDPDELNIYKQLESEFTVFDTLIDVGCAGLKDLIDFENSPFKKLIGISKEFVRGNAFGDYRCRKTKNLKLNTEQWPQKTKELLEEFKKLEINTMSLFDYDFIEGANSLIICNKVLHYFDDATKFELIQKFYASLQKGGLMYLKINHNRRTEYHNLTLTKKIAEDIYQGLEEPYDIHYPVNQEDFKQTLSIKYSLLDNFTKANQYNLTVVITK